MKIAHSDVLWVLAAAVPFCGPALARTPAQVKNPEPITVSVTDINNQPLEGAEAFLLLDDSALRARSDVVIAGRTDGRGLVSLQPSREDDALPIPSERWLSVFRRGRDMTGLVLLREQSPLPRPIRFVLPPAAAAPFRVFDSEARPLAGAKVSLLKLGDLGESDRRLVRIPEGLRDRLAVITDADGRGAFSLAPPEKIRQVRVQSDRFGVQVFSFRDKVDEPMVLRLRPTGRLEGRVLADSPEGVRGVIVRAHVLSPSGYSSQLFEAVTDREGRFSGPALPAESPWILALPPRGSSLVSQGPQPVRVVPGQTTNVELRLVRGAQARGIVHERGSGRPVSRALVRFTPGVPALPMAAWTDEAGRYSVTLPEGQGRMEVVNSAPFRMPEGSSRPTFRIPKNAREVELPVIEVIR